MSKRIEHTWKDNVEGKVCSDCREWKPLEQYNKTKIMAQTFYSSERLALLLGRVYG